MKVFYKSILILSFITLSAAISYARTTIFVSTVGKDTNPGTKEKTYATIAKTQIEARQIKGVINIILRGGTYYLTQPMVITSQDSRPDNAPVTFKSFPGESVIISGAVPLKLKWRDPERGYVHALHPRELGSYHFLINSKNEKGELKLERRVETGKIISTNLTAHMHKKSRFVEDIFEELDAVNE